MGVDDFKKSYPLRTVCEVTREIADVIIYLHKMKIISDYFYNQLFALLKEQMRMQKKMAKKLMEYKTNWDSENYQKNQNFELMQKERSGYEGLR